jgi:glutathione S-transferase
VFVDYFHGETRGAAYREAVNELGEVPVLDHAGRRLTQSGVILQYLATHLGRYGGGTEDERLEVLRWLLFDNHKFTSYYATLRFMVGIQKTGDPAVLEFLRNRVLGAFGIVEKHLATRAFVLGEQPTIADFSMVGYHYFDEESSIDRDAFPNIRAWTRRIADLPGWKHPYELMPRGSGG